VLCREEKKTLYSPRSPVELSPPRLAEQPCMDEFFKVLELLLMLRMLQHVTRV
jgi:hypothetical protein